MGSPTLPVSLSVFYHFLAGKEYPLFARRNDEAIRAAGTEVNVELKINADT
ncbi:MAG: hypothetical protein LBG96_00925 [Tannerella sp.]|jgi:hypothetical protein|nr:hypothetical protein [Tannerella sp.]